MSGASLRFCIRSLLDLFQLFKGMTFRISLTVSALPLMFLCSACPVSSDFYRTHFIASHVKLSPPLEILFSVCQIVFYLAFFIVLNKETGWEVLITICLCKIGSLLSCLLCQKWKSSKLKAKYQEMRGG